MQMGFSFDKKPSRSNLSVETPSHMLIILICIILAISVIGLGLYAYATNQKMLRIIDTHSKFMTTLAGALETYVVNDTAPDALGKKAAFDHIMLSIGEVSTYWRQFPPGISTMLKSIRDWTERQIVITRRPTIRK